MASKTTAKKQAKKPAQKKPAAKSVPAKKAAAKKPASKKAAPKPAKKKVSMPQSKAKKAAPKPSKAQPKKAAKPQPKKQSKPAKAQKPAPKAQPKKQAKPAKAQKPAPKAQPKKQAKPAKPAPKAKAPAKAAKPAPKPAEKPAKAQKPAPEAPKAKEAKAPKEKGFKPKPVISDLPVKSAMFFLDEFAAVNRLGKGTFFSEVTESDERNNKKKFGTGDQKLPEKPTVAQRGKERRGEESQEEIYNRILQECRDEQKRTEHILEHQLCSKCGVNPVEHVMADLAYCSDCFALLYPDAEAALDQGDPMEVDEPGDGDDDCGI